MPPKARTTASTPQAMAIPQRRPGQADLSWATAGGCCRVRAAAASTRSRSPSGARAAVLAASQVAVSRSPWVSWLHDGQALRWRSKRARSAPPRASSA